MKYSRLPDAELHKLEKEFVDFLVVNGITADDWEKLKQNDLDASNGIVDQFSDVVWEGVLRNTKYLEKREEGVAYYFRCDADQIHLTRIVEQASKVVKQTASKPYSGNREEELFRMIQSGCEITDGRRFEAL